MTLSFDLSPAYLLAVLALVFAHAAFQLGISVMTLLSSHTIGAARSHRVLLRLDGGYVVGVLATTFATAATTYLLLRQLPNELTPTIWAALSIAAFLVGLVIIRFYYRHSKGTALWIPRAFAEYLTRRTKRTKSSVEAFLLGVLTVVAELPFNAIVFVMFAFLLAAAGVTSPVLWIVLYSLLVTLPLLVLATLIAGGHKLSSIQKWREANKTFLQLSSGVTLILVGLYLNVLEFGGTW